MKGFSVQYYATAPPLQPTLSSAHQPHRGPPSRIRLLKGTDENLNSQSNNQIYVHMYWVLNTNVLFNTGRFVADLYRKNTKARKNLL